VNKTVIAPKSDSPLDVSTQGSPRTTAGLSPELLTLSAPLGPGSEAIRAMRTHIITQHVNAGRRALAIAAPTVDVGCTFVAANLAVALAQVGVKTLLIDADLRSPAIDKFIPSPNSTHGLSECLAAPGGHPGDFIDEERLPNLSVFYAGAPAENAQERLTREWFSDVMHHCMREYDFTVVDTPPANTSADVRRIGNIVGYGLVVARRNRTVVADVKTLVEQLIDDHVRVIGTLLNAD
jgi:protein-tyrosine kinase